MRYLDTKLDEAMKDGKRIYGILVHPKFLEYIFNSKNFIPLYQLENAKELSETYNGIIGKYKSILVYEYALYDDNITIKLFYN